MQGVKILSPKTIITVKATYIKSPMIPNPKPIGKALKLILMGNLLKKRSVYFIEIPVMKPYQVAYQTFKQAQRLIQKQAEIDKIIATILIYWVI